MALPCVIFSLLAFGLSGASVSRTGLALGSGGPHLCHLLPVGLRVEGSLRQQDWVLLRGDSQLVVERVMPDLLHVVPVRHDAVLDGVLQREDTPLALRLITHVAVLLAHADHHALRTETCDARSVEVTGKLPYLAFR